jgi:hypothetical protein
MIVVVGKASVPLGVRPVVTINRVCQRNGMALSADDQIELLPPLAGD